MAHPVRVLHVVDGSRPWRRQRLLAALLERSALEAEVESHVLLVEPAGGERPPPTALERSAASIRRIEGGRFAYPDAWQDVLRELLATRAAVVHSQVPRANVATRVAARVGGARHLTSIDALPSPGAADPAPQPTVDRLTAVLSDVVVAPSLALARAYARERRLPRGRVAVIPPVPRAVAPGEGFDRKRLRERLAGDAEAPLVLSSGDLSVASGTDDLIAAARALRRRAPRARFVIAGPAAKAVGLRALAARARSDRAIRLVEAPEDAGALLAAADVFCLPARGGEIPMRLIEAMSAGLPCVATDVGGTGTLLEDGAAGVVVEPGAPAALAAALARVLGDRRLAARIGERAAKLAAERHSADAVAARYMRLYGALAGGVLDHVAPAAPAGRRLAATEAT